MRKVSKYGVISGPYFPVFSPNTGKYGPEITPYLDTFHVVNSINSKGIEMLVFKILLALLQREKNFLRIQSECGKMRTRKTQNTPVTFHTVFHL